MDFSTVAKGLAGWRGYALVAAICFAAGGLAAGTAQGWRYGEKIASIEKAHADEAATSARIALTEMVRLGNIIAGIDADGFKELTRVKTENEKLRADVRTGALRLSVRTSSCVPGSATASGVGDEAARAELDAEDGDALLAITDEGDEAIVKLNTCIRAYDAARAAALAAQGGTQ